ncbi:uncharacterized protein LOC112140283 [Oryzias melastigma]|nr:uncharacterized protein LOC112140283 [Oryzias melastigma]
MEAGAALLLLLAVLGSSSAEFYGDSISFMQPRVKKDGTVQVTFYHRQNGRGDCTNQSSLACVDGACAGVDAVQFQETDTDATGQNRYCQTEDYESATVFANQSSLSLSDSGCCWKTNIEGKTSWTSKAELDLGTRSDSHSINSCPVTTTVSSLRIPQNCFTRVRLLAHDPDGDEVRCRFADGATAPANTSLVENTCTLESDGQVQAGVHVFEVMVEDFPSKNITLTYRDGTSALRAGSDSTPLCRVKLQFVIEVLQAASCDSQPTFLSRTPSHGDVLHAPVGKAFHLLAEAQATSQITDFQVSGPLNINKTVTQGTTAELSLNWTPQSSDLYRFVPICFTAETLNMQSEMRCVVVMVTQAAAVQGKATVQCFPNKMMVILEKASMPGIDINFLQLTDPSCSLTSNDTHIMGSMSFSTCGTKLEDKGDYMVFKNRINSYVLPGEVIVRRRTIKIDFSCEFPKTISISSYYNLHNADYIFTESSFGSFGYTFDIYRDGNFTTKVEPSAYPVQVKLMDMIYMGIQAKSELPNVTLFVESCRATPDDNPDNTLFYDLIQNGCSKDPTLKSYLVDQNSYNFEVQAFKFTGNYDQVYITCSVILCEPDNPFSRCAQGCLNEPFRRRKRGLSKETSSHYIIQGPLQFVRSAAPIMAGDMLEPEMRKIDVPAAVNPPASASGSKPDPRSDIRSETRPETRSGSHGSGVMAVFTSNLTTVVFATAFVVSVVLLVLVIRHYSRRRTAEDRKVLIEEDPQS